MCKKLLLGIILLALPERARADSEWVLEKSTLTYHVVHPLHIVDGVSHAAKGKGTCHAGQCDLSSGQRAFTTGALAVSPGAEFGDAHVL